MIWGEWAKILEVGKRCACAAEVRPPTMLTFRAMHGRYRSFEFVSDLQDVGSLPTGSADDVRCG